MNAKLMIKRHDTGPLKGEIEAWWVEDDQGHRWEIFSSEPPKFSVQYDTGESCGTGQFVLASDQDLTHGSELCGSLHDTPVGEFGVPCELEFEAAGPPTKQQFY
jgi:hypothetical protein